MNQIYELEKTLEDTKLKLRAIIDQEKSFSGTSKSINHSGNYDDKSKRVQSTSTRKARKTYSFNHTNLISSPTGGDLIACSNNTPSARIISKRISCKTPSFLSLLAPRMIKVDSKMKSWYNRSSTSPSSPTSPTKSKETTRAVIKHVINKEINQIIAY